MRIDAHQHVWDLSVRDQPWTRELTTLRRSFVFDDLVPVMQANGIDASIVVETINVAEETAELLRLAESRKEVVAVVGWVDLTSPDVAASVEALKSGVGGQWLAGVRHQVQGESDPRWLGRADVRAGLSVIANAGLNFDLLITAEQLPAAIETVAALPKLRFVLDHAGKPPIALGRIEPWRSHLTALAELPNVAVKLSGLVTEARPNWTPSDLAPYVEHLLTTFGPARTMFGSDWPVCLLQAGYHQWLRAASDATLGCSEDERAAIFGGTALDWYRITR